jgi:hypothetical protein
MSFDSKTSNSHQPLRHGDTEATTVGCRSTRPTSCARHSMEGVCAFSRSDGMCLTPPASWPRQFRNLLSRTARGERHNDGT